MSEPADATSDAQSFTLDPKVARDFCVLSGGFWAGSVRTTAWLLTFGLAAALLLSTAATVAMNHWNRWFFDALERKDVATVTEAVVIFLGIVAAMAAIGVAIVIARETLQVRWRQWLVETVMSRWLDRERYYRLNISGTEPPNPEYRISDDTRWATEVMVDLGIGLISAIAGAIAFIAILWQVGGSLTIGGMVIPAYMVWVAIIYGVIASLLIAWIGKPLVGRVGAKNEAEGTFRFAMMRLRDNPESVALMGGGPAERTKLGQLYGAVVTRWLAIVRSHGHVTWITNSVGPMKPIVPLLFAAPKYLSGELTLGQVTQLAAAFVEVQIAISWVVDNYNRIAEWYASARRVMDVSYACDAADSIDENAQCLTRIAYETRPEAGIQLAGLAVTDRAGRPIVEIDELAVRPGDRIFISGDSSSGKTMLIRAIAGLWRHGSGVVQRGANSTVMIAPQKSYIPLGTLAEALAYPDAVSRFSTDRMIAALEGAGLGELHNRLNDAPRWDQVFASGERQRLAIARVLLHRSEVIVLDEAMSALEASTQQTLLAAIARELPDAAILSFGQRYVADGFHNAHLVLIRGPNGARVVPSTRTPAFA